VGSTLFEHLHHGGWSFSLGFADEQMDVLGHDDVSYDDKAVTLAGVF
jgi:hypothetical protein